MLETTIFLIVCVGFPGTFLIIQKTRYNQFDPVNGEPVSPDIFAMEFVALWVLLTFSWSICYHTRREFAHRVICEALLSEQPANLGKFLQ